MPRTKGGGENKDESRWCNGVFHNDFLEASSGLSLEEQPIRTSSNSRQCKSDGTQIWAGRSAVCQKCSRPVPIHSRICSAVSGSARLPPSSVMTSTSVWHSGHQAKATLARRMIMRVSVSTVILVVFMATALSMRRSLLSYDCAHPARNPVSPSYGHDSERMLYP
jgi:hypothetical protein